MSVATKPLAQAAKPDRHINPKLVFAIVAPALLMASLDNNIINVGIRPMMTSLKTNLAYIGWTITIYKLVQTIIMPISGKLSDEWGRKNLFLMALVLFTGSSLCVALSPNVFWVIFFRALQAIGGATFMPSATGMVSDVFGEKRSTAIGLFGSIFPIGGILGPNVGGFILDHYSWHWMFLINVPIGIFLFFLAVKFLPSFQAKGKGKGIDLLGAGLFAGGISSLLYGCTAWSNATGSGIGTEVVAFFAIGIALLATFIWHEQRAKDPIIDIDLLRSRPFVAANLFNIMYGAVVVGVVGFIPYYAITVYGMSPGQSGLVITPQSTVVVLTSLGSSFLLIRLGYRKPMIVGASVIALGMLLISREFTNVVILGMHPSNIIVLAAVNALIGFGVGIANPASQNAALELLPDKIAAAAGLRGMFRQTGGIFATAIVVLLVSRSTNAAATLNGIFFWCAVVVVVVMPVAFMMPNGMKKKTPANPEPMPASTSEE